MSDDGTDNRTLEHVLSALDCTLDPGRFQHALTHRSYAYEQGGLPTNERLEFLGDSVLGIVVTEHLYSSWPDLSEGQLAKLRAAVVNSRALADVARGLGLGQLVLLGRGEETTGGRNKVSILADTTEAIIGAVHEQYGIERSRVFVHHLFDPVMSRVATLGAGLDWKTSLQEICSTTGIGVPVYEIVESGPDHAKHFSATVVLPTAHYGPGEGSNKKEAEQHAAELAFVGLQALLQAGADVAAEADGEASSDAHPEPGSPVTVADLAETSLGGADPDHRTGKLDE